VSLSRALASLSSDEHTERVLRDVLILFGHHAQEWLSESDVRVKTGRTSAELQPILPVLSDSFVLDFDRSQGLYRYSGDVVLGFEIDSFMRRAQSHESHVRSNVARFRERHGY
jgi:hypothetical protein